jgi:hypothetical protein
LDADRWADASRPLRVTVRTDQGRTRFHAEAMETRSGHSEAVPPVSAWRGRWGGFALALLAAAAMAWGARRAEAYAEAGLP